MHCLHACPNGAPAGNDLVVREIYTLSSNDERKLADWVAYRVTAETIGSGGERDWAPDPWLAPDETLEPPDYRLERDRLGALVTPRTRAIVLNSPNNPMGRVFDRDELDAEMDSLRRIRDALSAEAHDFREQRQALSIDPNWSRHEVTLQSLVEQQPWAEETARQVGQSVTDALAAVSGILFAAMVTGAFAAGMGGYAASVWQDRRRETQVQH